MKATLSAVFTFWLVFVSVNAYGFGANGHRVVGQIADNHLSATARAALLNILEGEQLSFAATWPDDMRSSPDDPDFWGYSAAANWHFVNVDPNETYEQSRKNNKGDAYVALDTLTAILNDASIPEGPVADALTSYFGDLNDPSKEKEIKRFAVRFIVHIIGDIHQPLHAGYQSDRGGNNIDVEWFGQRKKLHSVWDTDLVQSQQLSFSEIALKIDRLSDAENSQIQSSQPIDWVNESLELRLSAYDVDKYNSDFSYDYTFRFIPVIESQMLKAGLRTAALFNNIFAD